MIGAGAVAAILAVLAAFQVIRNPATAPEAGKVAIQPIADTGPPEPANAPFDAKQAPAHQEAWAKHLGTRVETTNSIGMKMVLIPSGEFLMGSTDEQVEAAIKTTVERGDEQWALDRIGKAERPQHKVKLTKPLAMSATEVTVGRFRQFVEATKYATLADTLGGDWESINENNPGSKGVTWRAPGYAVTDESPVTQVSWMDAAAFCNWLCEHEKLPLSYRQDARDGWVLLPGATGYRLPSEAQWEYACRAGTTTQYSFGNDPANLAEYGWYDQNSVGSARAVGLKPANPFGLYDMHGNAEEWCADWIADNWYEASSTNDPNGPPAGPLRVIRGGDWRHYASTCRSAFRPSTIGPAPRYGLLGFRRVRAIEETPDATATTTDRQDKPWNTSDFQQWITDVAAMPAEQQVDAVTKKLVELNPGFDGTVTPKSDDNVVTNLRFISDHVTNLSPLRALSGLRVLHCNGSTLGAPAELSDLTPLAGLALAKLDCSFTKVADLSPLKGMPLVFLSCPGTRVTDVSALRDAPLETLHCDVMLATFLRQ